MARKNETLRHLVCLAIQILASLVDFRRGEFPPLRYKITDYDPNFTRVDVLIIDTRFDSMPHYTTVWLENIFTEIEQNEPGADVNRVLDAILDIARAQCNIFV